ncbi:MAG: GHMP family kinase ATP-binding protein [Sulfuricaulis sp.]
MIISRTPFRISFFGGGTDYPAWYRQNGGVVLATTIDKYCYISCRYLPPFFEHKYRIVYSKIENVKTISEIEHPAAKSVLDYMKCDRGVEIHHDGDLPARSGLGSSSSFTVGLLNALAALQGKHISKENVADQAIHIEQDIIKENVGSQDQISAAYGGFNRIEFKTDDTFDVRPVILPKERIQMLEGHLMLFFTGFSRFASDIAKSKIENFGQKNTELNKMQNMVEEALDLLQGPENTFENFGKLLDESWKYKRTLSNKVSTPAIDLIYEAAIKAGASGGKILGAGGGGFMLLFVKPERQKKVREVLKDLIYVPFSFENSGSRIVMYQPNGLG